MKNLTKHQRKQCEIDQQIDIDCKQMLKKCPGQRFECKKPFGSKDNCVK